jgi:hypothetical protein
VEQAQGLLTLAEKDLEIGRLQKQLDEMPDKTAILDLRHRIKDVEALAEKAERFVHKANAVLRQLEDESASISAHLDAEQAKATSGETSNHKELQNLARELESLRKQKDRKETETLQQMERVEAGEAQAAKIAGSLEKAHAKEAQLIARFQERGGALQQRLDALTKERAAVAALMRSELLGRYERTRSAKHGIGVGVLEGSRCSVCRIELPAERAQALREDARRTGDPVGMCPNCRRILIVWGDDR